mmetsp:Transcript_50958/g.65261  ORF Transcript_50958/g.65261 Transcript_50958/m.65261 type:complete len:454 (-) Transcript_50958:206-1567(-)
MKAPDNYVALPDGKKPFLDDLQAGEKEYTFGDDEEKHLTKKDDEEEVGFWTSVINLSAAILGAGMLGLPYGFSQAGWLLSLCLLGMSGIFSTFTMHLLSLVSREIAPDGNASFYLIAEKALPAPYGTALVEAAVVLNVFGLATSYLVVFGSTMPYVLGSGENTGLWTNTYIWVTVSLCAVAPLAFQPTLDSLKFTSMGGMMAVAFVVIVVIYFSVHSEKYTHICGDDDSKSFEPHCGSNVDAVIPNISLLKMLSISTFAYTAHVQLLSVANEVTNYDQQKMDRITFTGILLCGIVYVIIGLIGYLAFGNDVDGNLILSYPPTILVDLARIAICGLVAISYPLMCKPGRDSFTTLVRNSIYTSYADSNFVYYGFTTMFLLLSYIIAMSLVNNPNALDLILSLIGCTCSTIIAYIVPTMVYARLHPEPHFKKTCAIIIGIFGIVSMPFCIYATFL